MGKRRFDETRFLEQGHEECLKKELLGDLDDARWKLENWGKLYNEIHPHSPLSSDIGFSRLSL